MHIQNGLPVFKRFLTAAAAAAVAVAAFVPSLSPARAQDVASVVGVVHQSTTPIMVKNLAYGPLSAQKLDLSVPGSIFPLPRPVIVLIHGGAFVSGDKAGYQTDFVSMMVNAGFTVANMDYRLSNGGPTVEMVNDVQLAIRWLKANAHQLGVAPGRICLNGWSAGGTLVVAAGSMHSIFPGDMASLLADVPADVRCVMDNSGPVTMTLDGTQQSVLGMVTTSAPPMFVTHGLKDPVVPIQQAYDIVGTLKQDQRPVKSVYYNAGHVMSGLSAQAKSALLAQEILFASAILNP